jgi:hypothetical protein
MKDLIYDGEMYPNILTFCFYNPEKDAIRIFEMSPWRNDWADFRKFVKNCSNGFVRWVGFNNYYFDYQVVHALLNAFKGGEYTGEQIARFAHKKAQELIKSSKDERFVNIIWDNNHVVPQVDLFRIHHFDNVARATSLKVLEFNMRSETVEDLPFDPMVPLTAEQRPVLLKYNEHDVRETYKFYLKTLSMIRFREQLSEKYGKNFINFNDTKIGKEYFIMELEKAGIKCFSIDDDGRKPIQTKRDKIKLREIIFPYVKFERPEFNAVLDWLREQEITETKGVFTELDDLGNLAKYANLATVKKKIKNLNCIVDGFQFDFGTGGIHGSIDSTIVEEDSTHAICDFDVTSLYPSIAIVNNVFPKHLTKKFCEIYGQMKMDRIAYPKGTPENAMLKLALNGVYGDSNNKFSPFYDPQYTMTITINGQLMLCMLAEMYMKIDSVKIIQINTDGITVKVRRDRISEVEAANKKWMEMTRLDLERADYKRMFIRDVNNYVGQYTDESAKAQKKKVKSKGAYEWDALYRPDHPKPDDITWHKNHSAMVVQMAVTAHLVEGKNIRDFIIEHDDVMDFMLRTKVPRTSRLMWGNEKIQNTTRYYMSKNGRQLTKVMPPLAKNPDKERPIKVHDGWKATPINTMRPVDDIDPAWYIEEAEKLVAPLYEGLLTEMCS